MVGTHKSRDQLVAIADRIMLEADQDKDQHINFQEFEAVTIYFFLSICLIFPHSKFKFFSATCITINWWL